ncbi:M23 family metallopeptidase [Lysobacter auxotrophicus]|uniref:Peptidoglycan DD-metalloendopeptidase family protein n=1 Tax=Lysobacter auxotrophicus TaxID=2992573 RepID=A0ABM8DEB2_9GAMM|nr:M23 family metallopeptidase [Lysobacter auxotrophicus]BDU16910.1 peptidoglycan DD-metalloendopeptidase family protein [Lysobacter auxotrophicus]
MSKAALSFLAIVLLGANVALFHFGRERGAAPPAEAATASLMQVAPSSAARAAAPASSIDAPSRTEVATPASPDVPAAPSAARSTPASAPAIDGALTIPVQGVTAAQLHDTFSDARAQGRVHEAIDIMAPRGTPVIAVADGTVEKLFTSVPGGLTIYQFEPSGRYAYYYAHLDRYADGLREKQPIRRGDVIGYVGSTGNADPSAPHLHFAIFELGPERQWWKGTALNPYPVLTRAQ